MLYTYLPALHTHAGLNGSYKYTLDLMGLEANKIPMSSATCSQITRISTPLNIKMWEQCLQKHPDKDFAGYTARPAPRLQHRPRPLDVIYFS